MAYTREQRAANAAKQANAAASEAGRVLQAQRSVAGESAPPDTSLEPRADDSPPVDVSPRNPVRQAGMEMIEARMKREGDPGAEPESEPEPEPKEKPVHPVVKKELVEELTTPPETAVEAATAPVSETVRVKVDGEEFDVPKAEIDEAGGVREYRILKAQENRLKKGADMLAETRREQQQFLAALAQARQPPAPQVSPEQAIKDAMQKVRFGTDDEANAAMTGLLTHGRIDPSVITLQATANIKYDMAQAAFAREFADVLKNPDLADLARLKVQRSLAPYSPNGTPNWTALSALDFETQFRTIGNQLRSVAGPRQSQPPATEAENTARTPSTADREARKASIVNLPTAAQRASLPAEEPVLTPEQERKAAIAAMNKARGKAY